MTDDRLATGLGFGQWIEKPAPRKPAPNLAERVVNAVSRNRGVGAVAAEIGDELDLPDEMIETLCQRLADEIGERQQLDAALERVLLASGLIQVLPARHCHASRTNPTNPRRSNRG